MNLLKFTSIVSLLANSVIMWPKKKLCNYYFRNILFLILIAEKKKQKKKQNSREEPLVSVVKKSESDPFSLIDVHTKFGESPTPPMLENNTMLSVSVCVSVSLKFHSLVLYYCCSHGDHPKVFNFLSSTWSPPSNALFPVFSL